MEKQEYRNGLERYQEIAKKIKKKCLKLEGKTTDTGKTLYQWNGFKVFIADGEITIRDEDEKIFFIYTNFSELDRKCQFGQYGLNGLNFSGWYTPKITDSYVKSRYQIIKSKLTRKRDSSPLINFPPDDITLIIKNEITIAKEMDYVDESNKDFNSQYIEELKQALDFFKTIEELAMSEKDIEETNEDVPSSEQTRLEKLREFFNDNPDITLHDVVLIVTERWINKSYRIKAEEHLIETMEQGKIGKKDSIVQE